MILILIGYLTNCLLCLLMIHVTKVTRFTKLEYFSIAIPFGVILTMVAMTIYAAYLNFVNRKK